RLALLPHVDAAIAAGFAQAIGAAAIPAQRIAVFTLLERIQNAVSATPGDAPALRVTGRRSWWFTLLARTDNVVTTGALGRAHIADHTVLRSRARESAVRLDYHSISPAGAKRNDGQRDGAEGVIGANSRPARVSPQQHTTPRRCSSRVTWGQQTLRTS